MSKTIYGPDLVSDLQKRSRAAAEIRHSFDSFAEYQQLLKYIDQNWDAPSGTAIIASSAPVFSIITKYWRTLEEHGFTIVTGGVDYNNFRTSQLNYIVKLKNP